MSSRLPLLVSTLLLLGAFAHPAAAQTQDPLVLRLEGHEGPLACDITALQLLCFEAIEGDPATAFIAGQAVEVELTAVPLEGAPGGAPHNLAVALVGDGGDLEGIDSDTVNALGASDVAESGETVYLEFTVPETGTLYFWCDVGEHEFAGMSFTAEIQAATDDTDDDTDDDAGGDNTTGDNTTGGDNTTAGGDGTNGTGDDLDADAGDANGTAEATDGESDADPAVAEESPVIALFVPMVIGFALVAFRRRR